MDGALPEPRVAVNGRFLAQRVTGVQRYAREVLARAPFAVETLAPGRALGGWRGHAWEQLVLPARFRQDVLWSPCGVGPLALAAQVVTVHDLAVFDHPGGFSPTFAAWYRWLVPRLARRARRVLTVSEFTRSRLVERLGLEPARVVVASNGVDPRFTPQDAARVAATRARLGLPERYVLAVGSRDPRKNLAGLLAAWEAIAASFPEHALVVAGGGHRAFRDERLGGGATRVHRTGYVDEDELPALYSGAELFAYPSLYEGFGLPVLEAFACGCPVVCSSTSSLPEVAGEAAVLVDPARSGDLAEAMRALLDDEERRAALSAAGRERARGFTWEACAERVWATLAAAAGE